jgi:hypothetical protein
VVSADSWLYLAHRGTTDDLRRGGPKSPSSATTPIKNAFKNNILNAKAASSAARLDGLTQRQKIPMHFAPDAVSF